MSSSEDAFAAGFIMGSIVVGVVSMIFHGYTQNLEVDPVVIAARVTAIEAGKQRLVGRGEVETSPPAIHVAQQSVHLYARITDLQHRSVRHWQCVWMQWNPDSEKWVYQGAAPSTACIDP